MKFTPKILICVTILIAVALIVECNVSETTSNESGLSMPTEKEITEKLILALREEKQGPLTDIFDFDWDEAFYLGAYSMGGKFEDELGYVFDIRPLSQSERRRIVFFLNEKKIYDYVYSVLEIPLSFTDQHIEHSASYSINDSGRIVIENQDSDGFFVPPG